MDIEMTKDRTIESAFRGYFAGVELPKIDLTAAKEALHSSAQKRSKTRRGLVWKVVSAVACIIVAIVLAVNLLPSLFITRYSLETAEAESLGYTEVMERHGDAAGAFSRFSLADNATAEYTVYTVKGREVLLRADLGLLSGSVKLKATVQVDLSNGRFVAEELDGYDGLEYEGSGYRYETEFLNGEYVSRARYERNDLVYYVDMTSQNDEALSFLMKVLLS